jgi:hypothetical protein
MVRMVRTLAAVGAAAASALVASACATSSSPSSSSFNSGNATGSAVGGSSGGYLGGSGTAVLTTGDASLTSTVTGSCVATTACTTGCTDLSSTPIIDTGTPQDAQSHFTATGLGSGGICITEPGDGTLLPNNWTRPRFAWVPASGQTLFEVRVHIDSQKNDLLAYTMSTTWTLPADTWKALAADAWGQDITVTVRGVNMAAASSAPSGSSMKFQIAPAIANGSLIYWAAVGDKNGDSWLEGFSVGDETVAQVLDTSQVAEKMSRDTGGNLVTQDQTTNMPLANGPGSVQCIGCHAAVPDHNSVSFLDFYPWPGVAASVNPQNTGDVPSWLTPGGAEALALPWIGMMTYSAPVWNAGQHIVVAGWQVGSPSSPGTPWQSGGTDSPSNLVWINVSTSQPQVFANDAGLWSSLMGQNQLFVTANLNKSYGYLARTGDSNSASCPTWSHDGATIAYASNNAPKDGRLATGTSDIYTVPYNDGKGGAATPVQGAADPSYAEYYPWYSSDDKYIAFDRAANSSSQAMYYNPQAEVYVVPAAGGTATRLAANDPPACLGATSPGVTNSWPKWSPQATVCDGKTYYWLIFSSSRLNRPFNVKNMKDGNEEPTSQLYLTAIVDDGSSTPATYPGVYIWNQPTTNIGFADSNQSNHTPLWDVVTIPASPPPPR